MLIQNCYSTTYMVVNAGQFLHRRRDDLSQVQCSTEECSECKEWNTLNNENVLRKLLTNRKPIIIIKKG